MRLVDRRTKKQKGVCSGLSSGSFESCGHSRFADAAKGGSTCAPDTPARRIMTGKPVDLKSPGPHPLPVIPTK